MPINEKNNFYKCFCYATMSLIGIIATSVITDLKMNALISFISIALIWIVIIGCIFSIHLK